ncbi:MAG TPA: cytochrome c oxidase subunit II [Candidatus Limnocylindrales bacterium]|nr:cytochrome c oxidase subunit II [Candidatus Limnocylindrales bacterium]
MAAREAPAPAPTCKAPPATRQVPRLPRAAAAGALLVVLLGGCAPSAVTSEGRDIGTLYGISLWMAAGVVALVWLLGIFAILRYRRGSRDDEPRQVHGSTRLEAIWTAIPVLIVLGLFGGTLAVLGRTEARASEPAVIVEVEAFRWGWTFRIPAENVEVSGLLAPGPEVQVPVGVPLRFNLTSHDVIHSFYVPVFLFKRDVIPGHANTFDVTIDEPGTYGGQCAEYCGIGHARMPFTIRAVSQAEYEAWVAATRGASAP